MTENPEKKRVLITGCSSGFGMYLAVEAAKKGYDVIATMRSLDKSGPLKTMLTQAQVTATIDKLDVTDTADIAAVTEKYAPIDILINNAGMLMAGSVITLSDEETRRIFETNYFGPAELIRRVVPQMIEAGHGQIINVASLAGLVGHMFNSAYSASKHALVGLTRSIKTELRPFDIKISVIEPGYHKTEIIRANANVAADFYNPDSPFIWYNRGFLRVMMEQIVPNAGDPSDVVDTILNVMETKHPKLHYIVGKDAKKLMRYKWLGMIGWIERKAYRLVNEAARLERKKAKKKLRDKGKDTSKLQPLHHKNIKS